MQVDVISSVREARSDEFLHKTVIVIDVLRATSTIVTALAYGCTGVVPVETVQQAKQLQEPDDVLGGERFCKKITGFHKGNSPFEYMSSDMEGRRLILTTTNGTRGIQKSQRASHVLAGCLLNARSCVQKALQLKRDIVILCAGTQDEFSLEDGLCAGLIVQEIQRQSNEPPDIRDFGLAMLHAYHSVEHRLDEALFGCANGKRLSRIGFRDDVAYCAQTNRFNLVPMLHKDVLLGERF